MAGQHRVGGFIPSEEPSTAPEFAASAKYIDTELPPAVDLRSFMTPVENQSNSLSCVGNALAAAYEFLIKKNTGKHIDVSRLFIYYNSRIKDGLEEYKMVDRGTTNMSAIDALAEFGCCTEESFPFSAANINEKPPEHCYVEGKKHRIKSGMQLRGNLNEMKACLAEGYPFIFGLLTYDSFDQAATNGGRVPMPNFDEDSKDKPAGWHAMLAVGYSDRSECFIVKNSWGEKWGENGYCYIPYQYMCLKEICKGLHAIKTLTDDSFDVKDEKQFWVQSDPHDYYHAIWHNKSNEKSDSLQTYILWIDSEKEELAPLIKQLNDDPRVHITYQSTFALGIEYLIKNIDQIKSLPATSIFQIVCRGYYVSEYKNALDLLPFLDQYKLEYVPITVITGHKSAVLDHLKEQASKMSIENWKSRIYVTSYHTDLITKINANIIEKSAKSQH